MLVKAAGLSEGSTGKNTRKHHPKPFPVFEMYSEGEKKSIFCFHKILHLILPSLEGQIFLGWSFSARYFSGYY